jgi:hypothetical protein
MLLQNIEREGTPIIMPNVRELNLPAYGSTKMRIIKTETIIQCPINLSSLPFSV